MEAPYIYIYIVFVGWTNTMILINHVAMTQNMSMKLKRKWKTIEFRETYFSPAYSFLFYEKRKKHIYTFPSLDR